MLNSTSIKKLARRVSSLPDELVLQEKISPVEQPWFDPELWGLLEKSTDPYFNAVEESLDALNSREPGKVYRGMTKAEYDATVGAGVGVKSTGSYSCSVEGTCFSDTPRDAESFVNFGRDNPTNTGVPTYIVEVLQTPTMYVDTDGYYKDRDLVPMENVTGVWECALDKDNGDLLVMRRIL